MKKKNETTKNQIGFYMDLKGNVLTAEDVGFCNKELMAGVKSPADYSVSNGEKYIYLCQKNATPIYARESLFPRVMTIGDAIFDIKIGKYTDEPLPNHCLEANCMKILVFGTPNTGKTCFVNQVSDVRFQNCVFAGTNISIIDDTPLDSSCFREIEKQKENFFERHILPDPSRKEVAIPANSYYLQRGARRCILQLHDIDGESCLDTSWGSKILYMNKLLLFLSANDLMQGSGAVKKSVDTLISKLGVARSNEDVPVYICISKADLLLEDPKFIEICKEMTYKNQNGEDCQNAYNQVVENTIFVDTMGRYVQTTHADGFDYTAFSFREKAIRSYLERYHATIYNVLIEMFPKISFCMVASIGTKPEEAVGLENYFEIYNPMFIDEVYSLILADEGLYPIKKGKEIDILEENTPKKMFGRFWAKGQELLKVMNLEEEEEE